MAGITKKPLGRLGYHFIEGEHVPRHKDEYFLRDAQLNHGKSYRNLSASEIEELVRNRNSSDDWNKIFVSQNFNPKLVKDCQFFGLIRIGDLEEVYLEFHDLKLPVGLYNSKIISCDFGDNVIIENVNYLSHYQIGSESAVLNVNEMACSSHAKFGNGILKKGETEDIRIWLELCNENGGRAILPFNGMLPGDAFLWSKYRDDKKLLDQFVSFTQKRFDDKRGYYGVIGERTIIKHSKIVKDVNIGSCAYVKGANKLKNLTINSSYNAKTQIGEGVELVNGIIGFGCRIFYGVKAVRFMMGTNSNLKYGARLINSYLGDNATISCCEVLNSFIFPGHEQHHNNSFLCAAMVMGQSNMAAGATIGSNHNSRGNDGEIIAGRGFWPGLCVSLKHNSMFATYTLLAKGDYPAELNIQLPFSLVINDDAEGKLKIMPGYWFLYNMYALARNSWKYNARDKRVDKVQIIEFDYLAPDSVNEIFTGLRLIEKWVEIAAEKAGEVGLNGRTILSDKSKTSSLKILAKGIEASNREVELLKAYEGYHALKDAVVLYATKVLVLFCLRENLTTWAKLTSKLKGALETSWLNVGGQLMTRKSVEALKEDIRSGKVSSWEAMHERYEVIGDHYESEKACHAYWSLSNLVAIDDVELNCETFVEYLNKGVAINDELAQRTYESRKKDYQNPFRKMVYDNDEEMEAVIGKFEDNTFIEQTFKEAKDLKKKVQQFEKRLLKAV